MGRAAERQFDYGIDRKERNLGLVRRTADLVVRHNALGRQDHLIGRHRQIDVHELQPINLRIAVGITTLHMDQRNFRIDRRYQQKLFAGEWAVHLDRLGPLLTYVGAEHRADWHERNTHGAGAKSHANRHVAPFLVARLAGFDIVAHHLGHAPENSLAEPARDDVIANA